MAAKRDEVTIREVYELIDKFRHESDERDKNRAEQIRVSLDSFEKRITDLYIEVYGEGETRGIKSRVGANEASIAELKAARKVDGWKSFITSVVTGLTAWAAATFAAK